MPTELTYDEIYTSKFIRASDIPDDGDLILSVRDVSSDQVGEKKEMKLILHFHEIEKTLVLNVTNAKVMADKWGKDPNTWIGKKVGLYSTEVTFGGKTTLGVRIRLKPPIQPLQQVVVKAAETAGADYN